MQQILSTCHVLTMSMYSEEQVVCSWGVHSILGPGEEVEVNLQLQYKEQCVLGLTGCRAFSEKEKQACEERRGLKDEQVFASW